MGDLKKHYHNTALDMPKRHFYTRFVRDLKEWSTESIDYAHFTVPLTVAHSNGWEFPSQYVGQYGVYEAVKHVYDKTPSLEHLVHDDHLLTSQKYFAADMEKAIGGIRDSFRTAHKIDSNAHAIFIAPGNERKEVEFCLDNLRRGVKEFLLKYSAPTSFSPKALPM